MYGNRGCLHDADGQIVRRHSGKRWIACQLQFRGRRRARLMEPGRYTELFFLDEATALAAGHRPCAECRRADYDRLSEIWATIHPGQSGADAIDAQLHAERLIGRSGGRRYLEAPLGELPDGTFVLRDGLPWLVFERRLLRWAPGGYVGRARLQPKEPAAVITPPSLVALLSDSWTPIVPLFHPTARTAAARTA